MGFTKFAEQRGLGNTNQIEMKGLKNKVIRGGFAKIGSQGVSFILRIGSLMVLARLLNPKDFGLVAMVTAITGIFSLFKDAGLSMATIQRSNISNEQMSTLFWVNMLIGALLAALLIVTAPNLATFYHEPRLLLVTEILAIPFLLSGATAQHSALLQRRMRFEILAEIDIFTLLAGISVAIFMAATGWGYWALVGQTVAWSTANTICIWVFAKWLPGMPRRNVGIRSMMHFGGMVSLNNLIVYLAYNSEKILLGRFWGAEDLGVYGRAYQLVNMPTENLNSSIFGIAFSALSNIQDDPIRQRRYFLKGYSLILAFTLPITIASALFADDIIDILLGSKWKAVVPIFRLLAPTIVIFALINPFGWFLLSTGRAGRNLKIAFVLAPVVIVAYIIGLPYGPSGVALAYSSAMTLLVVPLIAWCIHGTGITGRDILQTVSRPFVSGIVAAILSFCIKLYFGQFVSVIEATAQAFDVQLHIDHLLFPLLQLTLGGLAMIIVYLWMLLYVMGQKAIYLDLIHGFRKRSMVD